MIKYITLFFCFLVIPLVNNSSISVALMSYKIDFIYSMIMLGLYGVSIKLLKNNKNPIVVISVSTIVEDLIINLLWPLVLRIRTSTSATPARHTRNRWSPVAVRRRPPSGSQAATKPADPSV